VTDAFRLEAAASGAPLPEVQRGSKYHEPKVEAYKPPTPLAAAAEVPS